MRVAERSLQDLAALVDVDVDNLGVFPVRYWRSKRVKKSGGLRAIAEPDRPLKALQRALLDRVLVSHAAHPCARAYELGHSIATHAVEHVGKACVVVVDLVDFFPSTSASTVFRLFRSMGWTVEAARALTRLTTVDGCLPAGAPTSARLSNLVCVAMDVRLAALAQARGLAFSRFGDDLCFSGDIEDAAALIGAVVNICRRSGYRVNRKKVDVQRRGGRQRVTSLDVTGARVMLPREQRRALRAVEHRVAAGRASSISAESLAGWHGLQQMVTVQGTR